MSAIDPEQRHDLRQRAEPQAAAAGNDGVAVEGDDQRPRPHRTGCVEPVEHCGYGCGKRHREAPMKPDHSVSDAIRANGAEPSQIGHSSSFGMVLRVRINDGYGKLFYCPNLRSITVERRSGIEEARQGQRSCVMSRRLSTALLFMTAVALLPPDAHAGFTS